MHRRSTVSGQGGGNRAPSPLLLLFFTVASIVFFVAGYSMGTKAQSLNSAEAAERMLNKEQELREKAAACKKVEEQLSQQADELIGEAKKIKDLNTQAFRTNEQLYKNVRELKDANAKCADETEQQKKKWNEEDEAHNKQMSEARDEIGKLELLLHELEQESGGMSVVLLHVGMKRARIDNAAIRVALQLDVPPDSYEDVLLEKFGEKWGVTQTPLFDKLPRWDQLQLFVYNEEQEKEYFFEPHGLVASGEAGLPVPATVPKPVYFGREGSTFAASTISPQQQLQISGASGKLKPRGSILPTLTAMYDFAVCAYLSDNKNFTYPNVPMVAPPNVTVLAPTKHSLATLVETPLLSFCTACATFRNSPEFSLACYNRTTEALYGSEPFWKALSYVRFAAPVTKVAHDQIMALDMRNKRTIAVDVSEASHCARGVHAEWFSRNFGVELEPLSSCDVGFPSEQVVATIISNISGTAKAPYDLVLLFSATQRSFNVSHATNASVVELQFEFPLHEVANAIVMSNADVVVLSPYSPFSQIVMEHRLLRRKFNAEGISFL